MAANAVPGQPLLTVRTESWPIAGRFTISRGSRTQADVVVAEVAAGAHIGRGECVPYARYDETVAGVAAELEAMKPQVAAGLDRQALRDAMPAGAARNALDCALWDLAAKAAGCRAWDLAGRPAPDPVVTAETISLGSSTEMGGAARAKADRPLLKVKLDGEQVIEKLRAVRDAAPGARLIVDANEAWTLDLLLALDPVLAALGVEMIEQPLPAADDGALRGLPLQVPLCADESAHTAADVADLADRYGLVNIKLDKTGGLTEALDMADAATAAGLGIMVGCMVGTSLAMAPAFMLTPLARFVDLDGPVILARDRADGLVFDAGLVGPPTAALWG